jgi:hypothetical protein
MSSTPSWRRYLRLWGTDVDADIEDELEFHLAMRSQELIEQGWEPGSARQEAMRLFGDLGNIRNQCRQLGQRRERTARRIDALSDLGYDLMYAARRLWRRPVSSAAIVLSLTLGIGINTAMFTTIKAILLDRLPLEKPEELVLLRWARRRGHCLTHPHLAYP